MSNTYLGYGAVYRDDLTGELSVQDGTLIRDLPDGSVERVYLEGDERDEGEPQELEFGYDGFDGEDFGADGEDFGADGEDFGDDPEYGDDPELSGRGRGRGKKKKGKSDVVWGATVLSGQATTTAAGVANIEIRPQHEFVAEDVTFDGSLAGALVTSVMFGDKQVFSSDTGTPITVFAATGMLRGLVKGQRIKPGPSIRVQMTLTGAGLALATFIGKKPLNNRC